MNTADTFEPPRSEQRGMIGAPSPLVGEGWDEGDNRSPSPHLPPQGGGEAVTPRLCVGNHQIERSLINTLLVVCLTLGFVCAAVIYLPSKLSGIAAQSTQTIENSPATNLLTLLPQEENAAPTPQAPESSVNGTYIRFTPEPEPSAPFLVAGQSTGNNEQAVNDPPPAPAAQQGAQDPPAAPAAQQGTQDPPAAPTVQQGNALNPLPVNPPPTPSALTRVHRQSSLALYEPPKKLKDPKTKSTFSVPPALETDVNFWRDVYARYDSHHVVLHDIKYLGIVYGVIDFTNMDADTSITDIERSRAKQAQIDAERNSILAILDQLASDPGSNNLSKEGLYIRGLFDDIHESGKFANAKDRGVRAQTGQKDKFIQGLKYSGRYLGEIESVFEKEGLPRDLTFLVFVESMFNPAANSSVGARGIWQFMRGTAKIYGMKINAFIDERADPIRATYAAANLLRNDYENLGNWPLAINAYNAGRGRLQQAAARLGTTDIAAIVKYFDHPSYGFASRNFYMEFLAAMDAAKNYQRYFGRIDFDPPLRYDSITIDHPARLNQIAGMTSVPIEALQELNPALSSAVFAGTIPLPAGFELRVPEGKGEYVTAALARTPQASPFLHTVEDGQTLEDVASMYNISVSDILRANRKIGRHLSAGQQIRIAQ